jgi:hypothetical protein
MNALFFRSRVSYFATPLNPLPLCRGHERLRNSSIQHDSPQWTPALTVYVSYDGQLGRGNYDSNAVTGGVRISF